ncbi:MAG: GDSL-type esterase/lipase family protein, partial [Verrucomicrobiales bacterium]
MKTIRLLVYLGLVALHPTNSPAQVADKYAAKAKEKWEETIRKFEELDKKSDYPADSILFMGSSSIRLWDTLAEDMDPYPVIQRGYGGAKFQDLAVFAERIVHPHEFQAVVIFVANDIVGKDSDLEPEEVAALYKDVVSTVREKDAEAPIFLIAITPTKSRWPAWPEIKKSNAAMEAVCKAEKNVHFIRTEKAFLNTDGLPKTELFRDDQLHLNPDGYKLWTEIVRGSLEPVLKPKKNARLELERDGHWLV